MYKYLIAKATDLENEFEERKFKNHLTAWKPWIKQNKTNKKTTQSLDIVLQEIINLSRPS